LGSELKLGKKYPQFEHKFLFEHPTPQLSQIIIEDSLFISFLIVFFLLDVGFKPGLAPGRFNLLAISACKAAESIE
jgi:hypothetical protein